MTLHADESGNLVDIGGFGLAGNNAAACGCCRTLLGCDRFDTINPDLILPSTSYLRLSSGGPSLGSFVRHIDLTVTDDVDPCPFGEPHASSWGSVNQNPRSNSLPGYVAVFCNPTAYDSGHASYRQGLYESYIPFCQRRFDIITDEVIGVDDGDTEWYAEGFWQEDTSGGGSGGAWFVRWSESQGAAIAPNVFGPPTWSPVDGTLTILSLNPFHAIATLTPVEPSGYSGTLYYPSFLQAGSPGGPDKCSPFTAEWTEV